MEDVKLEAVNRLDDVDEVLAEVLPATSRGDEGILEGVTIKDTAELEDYSSESDEGVRQSSVFD